MLTEESADHARLARSRLPLPAGLGGLRAAEGPDLATVPSLGKQYFWLDLAGASAGESAREPIIARIDREANAVEIERMGSYLRVLLTQRRLDLSRPIEGRVGGRSFRGRSAPSLEGAVRTVLERGDPCFVFEAECVVRREGDEWRVSGLLPDRDD